MVDSPHGWVRPEGDDWVVMAHFPATAPGHGDFRTYRHIMGATMRDAILAYLSVLEFNEDSVGQPLTVWPTENLVCNTRPCARVGPAPRTAQTRKHSISNLMRREEAVRWQGKRTKITSY